MDYGPPIPSENEITRRKLEAMLCALATTLTRCDSLQTILGLTDWKKAGVTRKEFEHWWRIHREDDARRRSREADDAKRESQRKAALAKLSPEERHALGIADA